SAGQVPVPAPRRFRHRQAAAPHFRSPAGGGSGAPDFRARPSPYASRRGGPAHSTIVRRLENAAADLLAAYRGCGLLAGSDARIFEPFGVIPMRAMGLQTPVGHAFCAPLTSPG